MIPLKRVAVPLLGGAFQVVLVVKNLPANVEDTGDADLISGLERSPGEGMATLSSTLAWRNP